MNNIEVFMRALDPLLEKVRDLEARLVRIEKQSKGIPGPWTFVGAYTPGKRYVVGDLVAKGNTLYGCTSMTTDAPGESECWSKASLG